MATHRTFLYEKKLGSVCNTCMIFEEIQPNWLTWFLFLSWLYGALGRAEKSAKVFRKHKIFPCKCINFNIFWYCDKKLKKKYLKIIFSVSFKYYFFALDYLMFQTLNKQDQHTKFFWGTVSGTVPEENLIQNYSWNIS